MYWTKIKSIFEICTANKWDNHNYYAISHILFFKTKRDRKFSQFKDWDFSTFSKLLITKSTFSEVKTLDWSPTIAVEMIETSWKITSLKRSALEPSGDKTAELRFCVCKTKSTCKNANCNVSLFRSQVHLQSSKSIKKFHISLRLFSF